MARILISVPGGGYDVSVVGRAGAMIVISNNSSPRDAVQAQSAMIIGTAGHVDHGKTALIRALTGVETDRLAEEKKRGLSIDLGYAYQHQSGGAMLGFVDAPGHARFVPNMLSGALGLDTVLLVVAADDGPMPQTREHLAIVDLLGVVRGVVALTKCDRVDAARRRAVKAEIAALLAPTGLAGVAVFEVSAITGDGVRALKQRLVSIAAAVSPRPADGHFRLAVDRGFSLVGAGRVATGTVHAGRVERGDRLLVSPAGVAVRVRDLRCQGEPADAAVVGDRCALNLAGRGLDRDRPARGDWLVDAALHAPSARIDVALRVRPDAARPLSHGTPVHAHLAADDIGARVAVLDGQAIAPGAAGRAQIALDRAVPVLAGDRLILRDQSARDTLAGGRVLDPFAPRRGRRRPGRLAALDALADPDHGAALSRLVDGAGLSGVDAGWFARLRNRRAPEQAAIEAGLDLRQVTAEGKRRLFAVISWRALCRQIVAAVDAHHAAYPASAGIDETALRRALGDGPRARPPVAVVSAAVAECLLGGRLRRTGVRLARPDHQATVDPEIARLWSRIGPRICAPSLRPPRVRELADELGLARATIARVLRAAADAGHLWQVSSELFYTVETIAAVAGAVAAAAENDRLTVKQVRTAAGLSRNVVHELLEFFDRAGLTARTADGRRVIGDASVLFGAPERCS